MRILVVDDEKIKRVTLTDDLAAQGHQVAGANDGEEALARLQETTYDVVVTDLKMPKLDGMELLKRIKQGSMPHMEVIMMTAYGSIPVAVEAVKLGAFDFLTKPFRNEDLFPLLARIERRKQGQTQGKQPEAAATLHATQSTIVGESAGMAEVKQMVQICCRTDANVLLCGETGTGKDLISTVIHRNSHRHDFPYLKVACTLFPAQLIESELYGHEKGSFTGADRLRKGRFDLAEGGTLYLDDVDDIPFEQQAKLLRAIEEKVFERVGGTTPIAADVRIIASTKRNLLENIEEGSFRQDLYYRLDVMRITVPPLRERRSDIPLLANHLLERIANKGEFHVDSRVPEILQQYEWPGNVRELAHTLQRLYLVGEGRITAELADAEMSDAANHPLRPVSDYHAAMKQTERQLLQNAMKQSSGNKSAAATALGMKLSTFRDRLAKHGLG